MVYLKDVPFVLNSSDPQSKYFTTTEDVKIGGKVFSEDVLCFGPTPGMKSPVCLGCGRSVDALTICYECGWPICSTSCDKLVYHKTNECEVFKKCPNMSFQRFSSKRMKFHQYDCVLPLRVLFLREKSPDKWRYIEKLKVDMELRKGTGIWKSEEQFVVKFIRHKCKLKQFDEELIHKVCGAIEGNCFEVPNSKNNIRCIYAMTNYFTHNCVPNCTFVILPGCNFKIFFRASVDIKKHEKLTYSKIKPIMPTMLRRQELLQTSYISCGCERCSDPKELGSNFSTLKCPKCKLGYVLPLNSLEFESIWKCERCSFSKNYASLKYLYNEVERELNKISIASGANAMKIYEKLITKYEPKFHNKHAFLVYMKYHYLLLSLNGETFQDTDCNSIDLKINWLKELLEVFDVISPGYTCLRGTTLNMLHKAYVIKAQKFITYEQREPEEFTKYMTKALHFLDLAEKVMIIGKPFLETESVSAPST